MNQPESQEKNYAKWRRSAAREARLRASRAARPLAEDTSSGGERIHAGMEERLRGGLMASEG
jgi:hypothetical protein